MTHLASGVQLKKPHGIVLGEPLDFFTCRRWTMGEATRVSRPALSAATSVPWEETALTVMAKPRK